MERPYTIFSLLLSPIVALLFDTIIKRKLSDKIVIVLILICGLIASPLLFTKYSYGDFYSYWIVIAIIATILVFIAIRNQTIKSKLFIVIGFILTATVPIGLTLFARGFVGADTIYDSKTIQGYKIIYRRDPQLQTLNIVELRKTILFGLLEKEIDAKNYDAIQSPCLVELSDSSKKRIIRYDPCNSRIK